MVRDSIIMPGSVIKAGAVVEYSIIAENVTIGEGARVGARPEDTPDKENWGITVVGEQVSVSPGQAVPAKAMMEYSAKGEK